MLKLLLLLAALAVVGIVLLPQIVVALSWVLAFLILLMLGDLLLAGLRRLRGRSPGA